MSAVHSTHFGLLDPVGATITALQSRKPAREEAAEILVEAVQEFLRDDVCTVTLTIDGLSRAAWDEIEAVHVSPTMKRERMFGPAGGLLAEIEYVTDQGWDGR